MSLQEFDLIQRIRVEDGVPRIVSTTIQVIEGGQDLLSQAINILSNIGFYEKFDEIRTSQYIGFKPKQRKKGNKRYQLILLQKQDELCISIPQEIAENFIFDIFSISIAQEDKGLEETECKIQTYFISRVLVLPRHRSLFQESIKASGQFSWKLENHDHIKRIVIMNDDKIADSTKYDSEMESIYRLYTDKNTNKRTFPLNGFPVITKETLVDTKIKIKESDALKVSDPQTYMTYESNNLFPYTWKFCISSKTKLEEFIKHFAKILMEQN